MKKKIILFAFLAIFKTDFKVLGQVFSNESLQETYWNYRDRFRKNFIHIGNKVGKSIPFESLDKDWEIFPENYDVSNPNLYPSAKGRINFGDANITIGWYLTVLATEYRLLKDDAKDAAALEACQNELYFAIEAINRIDTNSKSYI